VSKKEEERETVCSLATGIGGKKGAGERAVQKDAKRRSLLEASGGKKVGGGESRFIVFSRRIEAKGGREE